MVSANLAPERLIKDLTLCVLWNTGSVAGVYEDRRSTWLIHFLHYSFLRLDAPTP